MSVIKTSWNMCEKEFFEKGLNTENQEFCFYNTVIFTVTLYLPRSTDFYFASNFIWKIKSCIKTVMFWKHWNHWNFLEASSKNYSKNRTSKDCYVPPRLKYQSFNLSILLTHKERIVNTNKYNFTYLTII